MLKTDIYQYSYSPSVIRKMIRSDDFWYYKDNITEKNIEYVTQKISEEFAKKNKVKKIKKQFLRDNYLFVADSLYDSLTIRRTNLILKDTLKITLESRGKIIKQIINVIDSEKNNGCYIFRTDVKQFYESIKFKEVIEDLKNKNLATQTVLRHLINLHKKISKYNYCGLPRGLSISSTLSEYCMKDFDKCVWDIAGVIFYSRYVDDIVIVLSEDQNPKSEVMSRLYNGLELNDKKTYYSKIGDDNFVDYLGYSINLKDLSKTRISKKKINKIKKRIALSIRSFIHKDNDFDLLIDRMKFLSGNSKLEISGRKKKLIVGFRYQFLECREEVVSDQLKLLDSFYNGILHSKKYNASKALKSRLSASQFCKLKKISFHAGYMKKMTHEFGRKRISLIKDAWRYE